MSIFSSEEKLSNNDENCNKIDKCKVILSKPKKGFIEFKNYKNKEKALFIVYADNDSLSVHKAYPKKEADPAKWFSKDLRKLAEHVANIFKNPIAMDTLTP